MSELFRILVMVAAIGSSLAFGQEAASGLPWESSVDAALVRAKALKRPILICMHWNEEKACRAMLERLYKDEDVQAQMREFILVGTAPNSHAQVTVKTKSGERQVSALFGTVSCEVLIKNEKRVKELWFDTPQVTVPQHIFVGPDGKIFHRKLYQLKKSGFIKLMAEAMSIFVGDATKSLDARLKSSLRAIKSGDDQDRKEAIRLIVEHGDPRIMNLMFHTIQGIKKTKHRAKCIRHFGYSDLSASGPYLLKWLSDPDDHIKNCAVVSLEETAYTEALPDLIKLFKKTKNPEIKKDILRALGPCGEGSAKAEAILVGSAKSSKERECKAVYLSLGYGLDVDSTEARKTLTKSYRREGKKHLQKLAILLAYHRSDDEGLIPEVQKMTRKEKNGQLKSIAKKVVAKLGGGDGSFKRRDYRVFISLYADDKIIRNEVQRWLSLAGRNNNGRNGQGGRGGR